MKCQSCGSEIVDASHDEPGRWMDLGLCHRCFYRQFDRWRKEYETPPETPTLRDRFAMAALTGLIAGASYVAIAPDPASISRASYTYADAMLKAREGK